MKTLLRTLVRIAIASLAVLDYAVDAWWATTAGNVFTFWAALFCIGGLILIAGSIAGVDYSDQIDPRGTVETWTARAYLLVSLLTSVAAGWWWCVSYILLGWLFWASTLDALEDEHETQRTGEIIPQHQRN